MSAGKEAGGDRVDLVFDIVEVAALLVDYALGFCGVLQLNGVEKHVDTRLLVRELGADHVNHVALALLKTIHVAVFLEDSLELLEVEIAVLDERRQLAVVDGRIVGVEEGIRVFGLDLEVF